MLFSLVAAPVYIHQLCIKVSFFLHPRQIFVVFFLMIAMLTGMRSTHCFDCISLIISDAEHIFICLLAIYISFLKKYLFSFKDLF